MDAPPVLVTARTRLRPVEPDDVPTLRAIRAAPAVAAWWHPAEPEWPFESFAGASTWTVEIADAPHLGPARAIVGFVRAYEEDSPDNDVAGIDLFLAASVHRHGLGREVVRTVVAWLVDVQGHHLVQIDPAAHNTAAIDCYQACGFRPVGVLPRYERDTDGTGWHDTLLMAYAVRPRGVEAGGGQDQRGPGPAA